jgi:hypothetical protein
MPKGHEIYQKLPCQVFQKFTPKGISLVWKCTIWQPWTSAAGQNRFGLKVNLNPEP